MQDGEDPISYSAAELVDRARQKGLHAIAITPHHIPFEDHETIAYAARHGLLLIPGVEIRIDGKEVLLINIERRDVKPKMTFHDLRELRQKKGSSMLVVAPHPFYFLPSCLKETLFKEADCFDAVEQSHFHGFGIDPNKRAMAWASRNRIPAISTSDSHDLSMVGDHYTEVETDRLDTASLFEAIRLRRVRQHSPPLSLPRLALFTLRVLVGMNLAKRFARLRG